MQRNSNLKQKTPLQKKTSLKVTTKKRPKQTIPKLTRLADQYYSKYIRLRDSQFIDGKWIGTCITCSRVMTVLNENDRWGKGIDNGHFITRGCKELRYDEYNCNMQCSHCNNWRDKESMQEAYRKAIKAKYGDSILRELKDRFKIVRGNSREELEQVIKDSKTEVEYMIEHSANYAP